MPSLHLLDISNAFGSLSHWVIFKALEATGDGEDLSKIIIDCYTDAKTIFKTSKGVSAAG